MENQHQRNHAPADSAAGVPAPRQTAPAPAPDGLDANGFDPADFEWRPVPRRPRSDGWTPERQQRFIEALARTGVVERACEEVGLSVRSAYDLRHAPGGEGFARAWAAVLTRAADRLLDIAFEQAIEGEAVPVFDQDGVRTGEKRRYNTRMAMFLLRAYHPERFRHAHKDTVGPGEAPPPREVPVARAVASLAPVTPAAPQQLSSPDRLADMVDNALFLDDAIPPAPPEPYQVRTAPPQHDRVYGRVRINRRRRAERDRRDAERFGDPTDDGDFA